MALLVGAIVGATAGAQDLDTGVFRDLAATGRSRTALFLSRVDGAWVVVAALVADHAGGRRRRRVRARRRHAARRTSAISSPRSRCVLTSGALGAALAVGLAALVGSRGPVIAILLAMHLVFEPQLQGAGFLGDARQALPISAINRIGDQATDARLHARARHRRRGRDRLGRRRARPPAHGARGPARSRTRGAGDTLARVPALPRGCASRRPARVDIGRDAARRPPRPCPARPRRRRTAADKGSWRRRHRRSRRAAAAGPAALAVRRRSP